MSSYHFAWLLFDTGHHLVLADLKLTTVVKGDLELLTFLSPPPKTMRLQVCACLPYLFLFIVLLTKCF